MSLITNNIEIHREILKELESKFDKAKEIIEDEECYLNKKEGYFSFGNCIIFSDIRGHDSGWLIVFNNGKSPHTLESIKDQRDMLEVVSAYCDMMDERIGRVRRVNESKAKSVAHCQHS